MRPRELALVIVSVISAVVCVRLGIWQLHRLHERRLYNASVSARLSAVPVTMTELPHDTAALHFRRVHVHGAYDYDHEITFTSRTRNGSPGVNILTPVRLSGDTAVLINRGWVYAADGVTADLKSWREGDSVDAVGIAEPFGARKDIDARSSQHPRAYRWLDPNALHATVPYHLLPYLIVLQGDTATHPGVPPRLPFPELDEGPHKSYAIQWFSFATIAIVGMIVFVQKLTRQRK